MKLLLHSCYVEYKNINMAAVRISLKCEFMENN
jgi:hypothetical protein